MNDFLDFLEERSGQPISRCYQCKKCSGGCPVSAYSEIKAHQLVRLAQMGEAEQLLKAAGIWYCVGCKTCEARCPNGIDVSAILDVVRAEAMLKNAAPREIPAFHTSFLHSVKRHGRVYELGMVVGYKFRVRKWTEDMEMGSKMFLKGKLSILPARIKARRQVKDLFNIGEGV